MVNRTRGLPSVNVLRAVIEEIDAEEFTTVDVMRALHGEYRSGRPGSAQAVYNQSFGRHLSEHNVELNIYEIEAGKPVTDDEGRPTGASLWGRRP